MMALWSVFVMVMVALAAADRATAKGRNRASDPVVRPVRSAGPKARQREDRE